MKYIAFLSFAICLGIGCKDANESSYEILTRVELTSIDSVSVTAKLLYGLHGLAWIQRKGPIDATDSLKQVVNSKMEDFRTKCIKYHIQ